VIGYDGGLKQNIKDEALGMDAERHRLMTSLDSFAHLSVGVTAETSKCNFMRAPLR
jgi:hypothetical protein